MAGHRQHARRSRALTPDELIAQSGLSLDEKMAAFERLFPVPLPPVVRVRESRAKPQPEPGHMAGCSCSLACELADMRRRTDARRAASGLGLGVVMDAQVPDVCGACGKPVSMKPDAVSRRKGKRPEGYRCPPCHRKGVHAGMSNTGSQKSRMVRSERKAS